MDTETQSAPAVESVIENYLFGNRTPDTRRFECLSGQIIGAIEAWRGWKVTIVAAPTRDLPLWRIKVRFQGGEPKLYSYSSARKAVKAWSV